MIVYCGQCADNEQGDQHRLGEFRDGTWFQTRDRRKDRARKHEASDGGRREVIISAPISPRAHPAFRAKMKALGWPEPASVKRVPARCPVHGDGWIAATDLIRASREGKYKVVLALRTT